MARFRVLRLYTRRKITKFNQGKRIERMHDDGDISDLVHNWAKSGICAALSIHWLKKAKRFRGGGDDKLMQKSLGAQYLYSKLHPSTPPFDEIGLREKSGVHLPLLSSTSDFERFMVSWMNNDGRKNRAVYVGFTCSGAVSGGHAVGARQFGDVLNFFDPNCGWYEIVPGKEEDFFRVYRKAYAALGISIGSVRLRPVV